MMSFDEKLQFELDKINLEVYRLTIMSNEALAKGDYVTSGRYYIEKKKLLRTKKILKAIMEV